MKGERCYLSCRTCGRRCNGTSMGRQNHRFDCCGEVVAHIPYSDALWTRVTNPMRAGFLTGPSTTTAPPGSGGKERA